MTEDNMSSISNVTREEAAGVAEFYDYDYLFNSSDHCDVEHGCMLGLQSLIVPILFGVIMLIGCLGNGFVALVVLKNRDQSKNTTNLFILNLSVADLLFLIFCVPFHAITHFANDGWIFGEFVCKAVHFIQYASMVASIFTLVAMSADRYLAVAFPLETKHLRTPRVALATALVIWLVAVGVASPWIPMYRVITYNETWWPQPIEVCADDWTNLRGGRSTYFVLLFIISYILPGIIIATLSALMVHELWLIKQPEGPCMEGSIMAKRKVTKLIIVVVVVFCVCWLPSHLCWLLANYIPVSYLEPTSDAFRSFYYVRLTAHLLSYANSCINPIIYAFMSTQFQTAFKRALYCEALMAAQTRPPSSHIELKAMSYVTTPNLEEVSVEATLMQTVVTRVDSMHSRHVHMF